MRLPRTVGEVYALVNSAFQDRLRQDIEDAKKAPLTPVNVSTPQVYSAPRSGYARLLTDKADCKEVHGESSQGVLYSIATTYKARLDEALNNIMLTARRSGSEIDPNDPRVRRLVAVEEFDLTDPLQAKIAKAWVEMAGNGPSLDPRTA